MTPAIAKDHIFTTNDIPFQQPLLLMLNDSRNITQKEHMYEYAAGKATGLSMPQVKWLPERFCFVPDAGSHEDKEYANTEGNRYSVYHHRWYVVGSASV